MGNAMNHEETVTMPGESNPTVITSVCPFGKGYMNPSAVYMSAKNPNTNRNNHENANKNHQQVNQNRNQSNEAQNAHYTPPNSNNHHAH